MDTVKKAWNAGIGRGAAGLGTAALVLAALAPAPALADDDCGYSELATVPLSFPGNGGHAVLQGQINGKPVPMMVDTGAHRTMLVESEVERQGLPKILQTSFVSGIGGGASLYSTRLQQVAIGPAEAHYTTMAVIDSLGRSGYGAVVGADFLLQSDLDIDFAGKRLTFYQAGTCGGWGEQWLAFWDPKAGKIPAHNRRSNDRRPVFEVLLNGQKVRAIIDTGASVSILDVRAAARAGVTPTSPGVVAIGKMGGFGPDKIAQWRAPFASFAIGKETIDAPQIRIGDMFGHGAHAGEPEMLLGRDFLMVHHVLLAPSQESLYFSYAGGAVFQ